MKHTITITKNSLKTAEWDPKYPNEYSAVRVCSPNDVDLNKRNGYSLGDRWAKSGETIIVEDGEFITYRINTGSHRSPDVEWHAVRVVDGETETVRVSREFLHAIADVETRAKALNSDAYALAVYIASQEQPIAANPLAGYSDEAILAEAQRRGLV